MQLRSLGLPLIFNLWVLSGCTQSVPRHGITSPAAAVAGPKSLCQDIPSCLLKSDQLKTELAQAREIGKSGNELVNELNFVASLLEHHGRATATALVAPSKRPPRLVMTAPEAAVEAPSEPDPVAIPPLSRRVANFQELYDDLGSPRHPSVAVAMFKDAGLPLPPATYRPDGFRHAEVDASTGQLVRNPTVLVAGQAGFVLPVRENFGEEPALWALTASRGLVVGREIGNLGHGSLLLDLGDRIFAAGELGGGTPGIPPYLNLNSARGSYTLSKDLYSQAMRQAQAAFAAEGIQVEADPSDPMRKVEILLPP